MGSLNNSNQMQQHIHVNCTPLLIHVIW